MLPAAVLKSNAKANLAFPSVPRISRRTGMVVACKITTSGGKEEVESAASVKLQLLDAQLKSLSSESQQRERDSTSLDGLPPADSKIELFVQAKGWPEIDSGFYQYVAGVLFLITIVNNLIYIAVFHDPPPTPLEGKPERTVLPRRRLKSMYELQHPELFPPDEAGRY